MFHRGIFTIKQCFLFLLLALLIVLGSTGTINAADKKYTPVAIESDAVFSRTDHGSRVTVYTHVVITQAGMKTTADKVVSVSGKGPLTFTCTGNPLLTDPGNHITAVTLELLPKTSQATFTGTVKMVNTRPKAKDAKKDTPPVLITITCDKLCYDYANHTVLANGHVTVVNDGQTSIGDTCSFDIRQGTVDVKTIPKEAPKEKNSTPPV